MRISDAIKMIMKDMHVNQSELARRTGLSRQAVYYRLREMGKTRDKKHSLGVDALVQLANGLNYKVVLLPKASEVSAGGYVVSDEDGSETEESVSEDQGSRSIDELLSMDLKAMLAEVIASSQRVSHQVNLLHQDHHDLSSKISRLEENLVNPAAQ